MGLMTTYFSVLLALSLLFLNGDATALQKRDSRPNILFILIDDQDLLLDSYKHIDNLQSRLIQQGTFFSAHYGHISQCCPARATLWTGRHAHNTNITSVVGNVPGGAWKQMQKNGLHNKLLPLWVKNAGYKTYYSGKIFNAYGMKSYCDPVCVEGFTKADILVDPRTYMYYNSSYAHFDGEDWSINKRVPGYSTDQIGDYVSSYIEEAVKAESPFFAVAAPVAPHIAAGAKFPNNGTKLPYPVPKKEYEDLYQDLELPKSLNFNPANRSGVNVVWNLDRITSEENLWFFEEFYRRRQRALKSVDDMIGTLLQKLEDLDVLDNTMIIYTSDNGYHIGNHRLQGGKLQCFEEDINIPLIMRGPGVGVNQTTDLPTGHIDMAPTILQLAGVDFDPAWKLDGTAISFPFEDMADYLRNLNARGDSTHLEFWGPFKQEAMFNKVDVDAKKSLNIYKALRLRGKGYNLMYSAWCQNGE
jgi:N-acetylglucosamine-6-sulfatase